MNVSPRAASLALLAALLCGAGCAPSFPERSGDVDAAGRPIVCSDFREVRLATPWDRLREPAPRAHQTPLGCTTARSLRAMVDRPADLEGGTTGPARSLGASPAVQRYADGAVKAPPATSTLTDGQ